MPFRLHSAPVTFQRLLDTVLIPKLELHPRLSRQYYHRQPLILGTFIALNQDVLPTATSLIPVDVEKCHFCQDRLNYLGHIVDRKDVRMDPDKVSAISQWPALTTLRQVRQFLGMASWYQRFVPDFSNIATALNRLTRKNQRFEWSKKEKAVFRHVKDALTNVPVLACLDFSRPFVLQTDASFVGLGTVLTQEL